MKTSLPTAVRDDVLGRIEASNARLDAEYPGEPTDRQPVHTIYGGAQLFKGDSVQKLGRVALNCFETYAPNLSVLAKALGLPGAERLPSAADELARLEKALTEHPEAVRATDRNAWLAYEVYQRTRHKLNTEPVEDFRIDFEDGYGFRPDEEEDHHAEFAAKELAKGMADGALSPFIGIRIKPFTEELKERSVRTLDIFLSTLAAETGGRLPANFRITLPKVRRPDEVAALVSLFEALEANSELEDGSLTMEVMIETTQAIMTRDGTSNLPGIVDAGAGRCAGAHFGTYDYTAWSNITAAHQHLDHPDCDFALRLMKVAFAHTGLFVSQGSTNVLPVGPHRAGKDGPPLTEEQERENRAVVHRSWRLSYGHIRHTLANGFFQGWDLHPNQVPVRFASVYAFFLESLEAATHRLETFVDKAAQATLVGDTFDDAATGQGLLNYFLRGVSCGAITEEEALRTGLTLDEIRSRSFLTILENRK